jgi:hypothetical protein
VLIKVVGFFKFVGAVSIFPVVGLLIIYFTSNISEHTGFAEDVEKFRSLSEEALVYKLECVATRFEDSCTKYSTYATLTNNHINGMQLKYIHTEHEKEVEVMITNHNELMLYIDSEL